MLIERNKGRSFRIILIGATAALLGIILLPTGNLFATEATPVPMTPDQGRWAELIDETVLTKQTAPGDTAWIRVYDDGDASCDATGNPADGGQGIGAPGYATWCWEGGDFGGGVFDTCAASTAPFNPGCFDHYDVFSSLINKWHNDTFLAFDEGDGDGNFTPDSTPWCGEFGDTLIWSNAWGYGPIYNFGLVLNLGSIFAGGTNVTGFNATAGYTLGGVHMYDVEINYDYCYLEYAVSNDVNTAVWMEMARYNGTSNIDGGCTGTGGANYGCARYEPFNEIAPGVNNNSTDLLIRWRFASDSAWDDEDGNGGVHTDGAWRIDHVRSGSVAVGVNYPATPGTVTLCDGIGEPRCYDFEGGFGSDWTIPSLPQAQIGGFWSSGVWVNGIPKTVDWWHLELDPPYENKGNLCWYTNNWMWAAKDLNHGQNLEDGYHYRLVTPVFDTSENNIWWDPNNDGPGPDNRWNGVVLEQDEYLCILSNVGDVTDQQVRVFNGTSNVWSRWGGDNYVTVGGCQFWNLDKQTNWSSQVTASTDSIQFSWEFLDRCDYNASAELPCMGFHRRAQYLIDNVSIGLYESSVTQWSLDLASSFQDTYARDVDMHSALKENSELFPADIWEDEDSLAINVSDFDGLKGGGVKIHWRISTDCGNTWDKDNGRLLGANDFPAEVYNQKILNLSVPDDEINCPGTPCEFNGTYRTRLTINDNSAYLGGGATEWPEGTIIEYFFSAEDSTNVIDTFPNRLSSSRTDPDLIDTNIGFDRRLSWPFDVSVLPCPTIKRPLPPGQLGKRILLVNNFPNRSYDIEQDPNGVDPGILAFPLTSQRYRETLDRAGLIYDVYDNNSSLLSRGSLTGIYSQPTDHDGYGGVIKRDPNNNGQIVSRRYDAVIWFFGTMNSLTVLDSSQIEITRFIDRADVIFPGVAGASLLVVGDKLCEDDGLSDPAWVNGSGLQTTNAADFWINTLGLQPVAGGCAANSGVIASRYRFIGQPGTILQNITHAVIAQGGCDIQPVLPTNVLRKTQDSRPIARESNDIVPRGGGSDTIAESPDLTSVATEEEHPRAVPNKTAATNGFTFAFTASFEMFSHAQEADCVMQAVLMRMGVGIPSPKNPASCVIDVNVGDSTLPPVSSAILGRPRPNPFNPAVSIPVSIPAGVTASVEVFDVSGRRILVLRDEITGGAEDLRNEILSWDGKDETGKEAPSGIYFIRLSTDREKTAAKVVLIR